MDKKITRMRIENEVYYAQLRARELLKGGIAKARSPETKKKVSGIMSYLSGVGERAAKRNREAFR